MVVYERMSSSIDQVKILFEFLHHVSTLGATDAKTNEDGFSAEFHSLKAMSADMKTNNEVKTTAGSLPINKKKNRYKDILPFEKRRVELYPVEGEEGTDYINASYIADPLNKLSYIAAQGPNSCTLDDFWRMLWYHAIEVIIMACREVELGKSKCKNYWVIPGEVKQFGMITVSHISEENITEDFLQRRMHVRCGDEDQMLTQLHYTGWPDHGVPSDVVPILNLIKKFRSMVPYGNDVPLVIHCSAGCGRTGALIAIDYAWALLESKKFHSPKQVYEIVRNMRLQRPAMVQTKDQYVLVYKAIFQLVRQYLDEYQHDPSVAHLFDSTIKAKLSEITLPVYQNPSGMGEEAVNVELGGEINEEENLLSASGHNTPSQTPKGSFELNNHSPKPSPKLQKPSLPKKPISVPKSADPPRIQNPPLDPLNENEKSEETSVIRKYIPPTIPNKPVITPNKPLFEIKPRTERQGQVKSPSPNRSSLSDINNPSNNSNPQESTLTSSLPINSQETKKIPLPTPYNKQKVNETSLNHVVNKKTQEEDNKPDIDSSDRPPMPLPKEPRITKQKSPLHPPDSQDPPTTTQTQGNITDLLKQASLDQGGTYSDDEDDYWQPTNNQPVSPTILQQNKAKEKISLNPPRSPSPPPLLPPRNSGSNTNLTSISSLSSSTDNLANAPPIPSKSMQDKFLIESTELILSRPPSSSVLAPNPNLEEADYDVIGNIQKEISPMSAPEIYKSPTSNEPVKQKPLNTAPYQPRVGKGMVGIIEGIKKRDLFKQKSSNPTNSPTPNIPTSETLVTNDKKGKVEYGPVGFGIRIAKPNGPRTTPFHWEKHSSEPL